MAASGPKKLSLSSEQLQILQEIHRHLTNGWDDAAPVADTLSTPLRRQLLAAAAISESETLPYPFGEEGVRAPWNLHTEHSCGGQKYDDALLEVRSQMGPLLLEESVWVGQTLAVRFLQRVHVAGRPLNQELCEITQEHERPANGYSIRSVLCECFRIAASVVEGHNLDRVGSDSPERHARALIFHVLGYDLRMMTPLDFLQKAFYSVFPQCAMRDFLGLKPWFEATKRAAGFWLDDRRFGFGSPALIGNLLLLGGLQEVMQPDECTELSHLVDAAREEARRHLLP